MGECRSDSRAPPAVLGHHPVVTDAGLPAGWRMFHFTELCPCELPDLTGSCIQFATLYVCPCPGRFPYIATKCIYSLSHFLDIKLFEHIYSSNFFSN